MSAGAATADGRAGIISSRIARIETIRIAAQPNILWVELTDGDGFTGLGETYYIPTAVEAVIHDMAAPLVLGRDGSRIEDVWQTLFACANFYGFAGSEMRAFSALDIALWDLLGKRTGLSVSTLLGGRVRDEIRIYNTCVNAGGFDDMDGWLERPGDLAEDLLADGFTAMKIWPWDRFAPQIASELVTGPAGWSAMGPVGHDLTPDALEAGLATVEGIRDRVGTRMDVMIEGHSRWDVHAALRICRALEPYEVAWVEDIIQPDNRADLARLASETRVPQCVSERLIGKHAYRDVLEAQAAHVVMVDVVWTGGLSEARKVAHLADAYHLPVVPHDCVGPISLAASLQLCAHAPNAKIMEIVRGFHRGWYHDVVTNPIPVANGRAVIPNLPGLATELLPEVRNREDAIVRTSTD
ncbi:MAG: mandelate racemase/muconate lactonizing enzyme family protein [Actinomycetota bacterium]|nr:mandelate racemase/muconate lactonizing enzyme family protein [Actinomycetota bacterium]